MLSHIFIYLVFYFYFLKIHNNNNNVNNVSNKKIDYVKRSYTFESGIQ